MLRGLGSLHPKHNEVAELRFALGASVIGRGTAIAAEHRSTTVDLHEAARALA